MAAAVSCGRKRSYFEDVPTLSPVSKRLRCSSSSSLVSLPTLLDQLQATFPHMNSQVLEKSLKDCGSDIESAIKTLHELSSQKESSSAQESIPNNDGDADNAAAASAFVKEMMSATSVDDAMERAARMLKVYKKSINARTSEEATQNFNEESMKLKEQNQALMRDNSILKRAVVIQHERQKEYDDNNKELQILKELVSQYQEQLRKLEVKNYALTMHLKQAQQSSSILGQFHPHVF